MFEVVRSAYCYYVLRVGSVDASLQERLRTIFIHIVWYSLAPWDLHYLINTLINAPSIHVYRSSKLYLRAD